MERVRSPSRCQYKPWSRCTSPCVRVARYTTRRDVTRRRYCREPPGALKWRQGGSLRRLAQSPRREEESFEPELPQEPTTPVAMERSPTERRRSESKEAPIISDAEFNGFLNDVVAEPSVCLQQSPRFLRAVVRRLIDERLATRAELLNANDAATLCPALYKVAARLGRGH